MSTLSGVGGPRYHLRMLPRMLAIDLDGTLLPRSKELTARGRNAVRALSDAGTVVAIATGKSLHLAERYAAELALADPVIALDGGLVRDGGSSGNGVLARVALPREVALAADEILAPCEVWPFLVDGGDRLLIHEGIAEQEWFLAVYADRRAISPSPLEDSEGDPFFVSFRGRPDEVRRAKELLRPLAEEGWSVFDVHFLTYDASLLVLRPDTSKGVALALVAEHLGIRREDVAAVGDWRNDTEMIRWAGLGVAMRGSSRDAPDAADLVLPEGCEDDGVAKWIEGLLAGA
jgi:Cof subfamily protein (haloacid dehalogenase superfamily)